MIYWKFEDNKKRAARSRAEVEFQKNVRNNSRGQNNLANYLTFKAKKAPLKFEKLKPEFGAKYPK